MHETDRVIRHDRGGTLLGGCQQRLRLRPGAQLVEVDIGDRVRHGRQIDAAGVDHTDTGGDPAQRLKPRGIRRDRLVARAIDVLNEQHSGLTAGAGSDDIRHWHAPGSGHRHRANLDVLWPGCRGRPDTHHGGACAAVGLVTHQPRRTAPAEARHADKTVPSDGGERPRRKIVRRILPHQTYGTRLSRYRYSPQPRDPEPPLCTGDGSMPIYLQASRSGRSAPMGIGSARWRGC